MIVILSNTILTVQTAFGSKSFKRNNIQQVLFNYIIEDVSPGRGTTGVRFSTSPEMIQFEQDSDKFLDFEVFEKS